MRLHVGGGEAGPHGRVVGEAPMHLPANGPRWAMEPLHRSEAPWSRYRRRRGRRRAEAIGADEWQMGEGRPARASRTSAQPAGRGDGSRDTIVLVRRGCAGEWSGRYGGTSGDVIGRNGGGPDLLGDATVTEDDDGEDRLDDPCTVWRDLRPYWRLTPL